MGFISYAQNFEDVILWRALKGVEQGFYIDVGANDPTIDSVTKAFYDRGWHGINIEPLPSHHADLERERPRDINLQCAAASSCGEIDIWECDIRGWATTSSGTILQHSKAGYKGAFYKVAARPLGDICADYVSGDIHFLKIDVEGYEKTVIEGMNFKIFRPWIILVESTLPNSTKENFLDWEMLITSNEYIFAYADGLNRFYISKEQAPNLSDALRYPPNVFDDFIKFQELDAVKRLQHAEAKAFNAQEQEMKVKAELELIYNSFSYKVTAPLRWINQKRALLCINSLKAFLNQIFIEIFRYKKTDASQQTISTTSSLPRVALDMYVLGQDVKTGVYRVCDELFKRLAKRNDLDVRYMLRSSTQSESLKYLDNHGLGQDFFSEFEKNSSKKCDVLLSPFGVAPKAWLKDKEMLHAHLIYDLIAIRRPDLFTNEAVAEVHKIIDSLSTNSLVFVISEYTRNDLLHYRPDLSPNQVVLIPLAAGDNFSPIKDQTLIEATRKHYLIPVGAPYILSLATLEVRKNLNRVVDSFITFMNKYPKSNLHLVLAGMSGWKLEALQKSISSSGIWRERIILTGFVEDVHLSALYSGALSFIYLSECEGFGLPPLEAMACGTPVVCANNSSLPEVVGDAGVMVDVNDHEGISESIFQLYNSEELRNKLSIKGVERAKLFSWEKCENRVAESLKQFVVSRVATVRSLEHRKD